MVEHRHNMVGKFKQDNDGAQNINNRHKRHDKLGNIGNTVYTADDNHAGKDGKHNAHRQRRHTKRNINCRSNGIGLCRITDKAQCDNQRNGKETGQKTRRAATDFRSQAVRNIKRRSADIFAVADHPIFLREQGFGKNRGHPQSSGNPHPKNRSRPACGDSGRHAGDIARTDLRGYGNRKRLKLR